MSEGREISTAPPVAGPPHPIDRPQVRLLADTVPHIVWTATGDGAVEYFNVRWYEYTGMSSEDSLAPLGWRAAVHPDDLGRLLAARGPAVEAGRLFQLDVRLRDRAGVYRWHMVRSAPVRDEAGRVARRFGTATDVDDRRRSEEELRESEARFRFLSESIPQLVWTAGPDGRVDYASRQFLERLGARADQVEGRGWIELVHPDDRERAVGLWERAVREGADYRVEYRLRDADTGGHRWFLGQARPQRDENGRVTRWYGTCTDIDAQWRAQREIVRLNRDLWDRVDVLETLFETVPIGIAIAEDAACDRIRSNPALEGTLEVAAGANTSLSAPEGQGPRHFRYRRGGQEVLPENLPMQTAARTGRPVVGAELEMCLEDGRTKWVYGNASPLFDEEGRPRGAVGAFMDMTEWRRVEAALKDNEERLRLAVEATDLGLFDQDLTTGALRWSGRCKAIFGLPPGAPIHGQEYLSRLHPDDRAETIGAIERALVPEGRGDFAIDHRCVWDDGSVHWVAARGQAFFEERDGRRQAVRMIGTMQDVTARKQAEAELTAAKEAAETASQAKDRFLSVLSHELRTPLSPVVTTVALLQMNPDLPEDIQEHLAMVRRNIALETRLIDDLLDLSRAVNGKLRLDPRPTRLNELVRHVLELFGDEAFDKGLVLESKLEALEDLVNVDPARMQQAVWNLLKNAARFTASGGRVRALTRSAGPNWIEVEVQDTGRGIRGEALPFLFDPFQQSAPGGSARAGGLDLGLAIAKAVVDRHGGELRAASAGPDQGSAFTARLPLAAATTTTTAAAPPELPGAGGPSATASASVSARGPSLGSGPAAPTGPASAPVARGGSGARRDERPDQPIRVLLVEDHGDTARAMVKLLERSGYQVHWADSVAAAVERAQAGPPFDVVVSDLGLPDGSGYSLMRTLKERHGARGIALSGFGMDGDVRRGREAGFLEHLVKPVDISTLDQTIRRVARDGGSPFE